MLDTLVSLGMTFIGIYAFIIGAAIVVSVVLGIIFFSCIGYDEVKKWILSFL